MIRRSLAFVGVLLTAQGGVLAAPAASGPVPSLVDATFDRIDAILAQGLYDVARDLLNRNEALLPASRGALARAEIALASGSIDEAADGFAALIGDPELRGRAQLGLGLALLRQGKTPPAVAALDAALAATPGSTRAWIARGVAADRDRDWTMADAAYGHALKLVPNSTAALINRGYSRLIQRQLAGSIADSKAALALDSKLETAANNLRLALAMQGDYKAAASGLIKSNSARNLNAIGFAAMSRGDYAVAEAYFNQAMAINPQFDRIAWSNLVYLKQVSHAAPGLGIPEQ